MKKSFKFISLLTLPLLLTSCGGATSSSIEPSTTSDEPSSTDTSKSEDTSSSSSSSSSTSSSSEPIITDYKLNLSITTSMPGDTFGNIQFIFNYDNSTSNYTWNNEISKNKQTTYSYTYKDKFDGSKPLFIKLYVWDTSLGNIYIGLANNANFSVLPDGNDEIDVNISFNYPTTSGNVVGNFEQVFKGPASKTMTMDDITIGVYGSSTIISPIFDGNPETFVATYEGDNIRIDNNNEIVGLRSGTTTEVTLTSSRWLTTTFKVNVKASTYKATSTRDSMWASKEKWFNSNTVEEIPNLGKDFMNGFDISSVKALYDNGSKFFYKDNKEESLFLILKDNGINWIRLKLFVDPFSTSGESYGSGEASLENVLWEAYEAKSAGLNLLLDFHYSDYWAHPAQQILPKAWRNANSVEALATLIKNYTKDTLNTFRDHNCLPDMVQLGNEISSGNFLQVSGSDYTFDTYGNSTNKNKFTYQGTAGSENMIAYLKAASEGVDLVDSSIKKVIHWAKGSKFNAGVINNFYNALSSVNYDYAGLSIYPYYCFPTGNTDSNGGIDEFNTVLSGLDISKPWFIAEASYPFSSESYVYENNFNVTNMAISGWTSDTDVPNISTMRANYPFSPAGQAKMIHDLTYSTVRYGGLGIFYWEGAWIPNANVGWSLKGTSCSWSNQGFFSYNGKAIGNLDIFAQMSLYI